VFYLLLRLLIEAHLSQHNQFLQPTLNYGNHLLETLRVRPRYLRVLSWFTAVSLWCRAHDCRAH
jgi:hypothetical protein